MGVLFRRSSTQRGRSGRMNLSSSTLMVSTIRGYIGNLLRRLREGNDVVIGSRFIEGAAGDIPAYRKVGMKVLDTATQYASELKITDSQSGFRAYGKQAIQAIQLDGNGMSAGSEILIQIGVHDLKVAEEPIRVRYDLENTSSLNPLVHGLSVLNAVVKFISCKQPILFFGMPGVLLTAFGIFVGFMAFTDYYNTTRFPFTLSMVSALTLIMGMLLITSGLILNSLVEIMSTSKSGGGSAPSGGREPFTSRVPGLVRISPVICQNHKSGAGAESPRWRQGYREKSKDEEVCRLQ